MAIERGPNVNLLDHIEPIRDSPLYNTWRDPIPPEWFTVNKRAYTLVDQEALYGSLQFTTFLGRTANVTISAPTITAVVAKMGYLRQAVESLGTPTQTVATSRNFFRSTTNVVPTPTDAVTSVRNSGALVNPMVDEYP